jgi:hypothetical protein
MASVKQVSLPIPLALRNKPLLCGFCVVIIGTVDIILMAEWPQ